MIMKININTLKINQSLFKHLDIGGQTECQKRKKNLF